MNSEINRFDWIDGARGVGIALVVFCHIFFVYTRVYIYSFLIPLFFFLSGICYRKEKFKITNDFAIHRAKRLLYPYFIWSFILFIFWAIADSGNYSIIKGFVGILYGVCDHNFLDWGMMMWFIPTLFLTEIIYDFVSRRFKKVSLAIMIISLMGFTYSSLINIELPWGLNISMVMLFFYHSGVILRDRIMIINKSLILILLPILLSIYYITSTLNGNIFSERGEFQNPLLYIFSGLSGTLFIILILKLVKIKPLTVIGKNSLPIMVLHLRMFTIFKIIEAYILKIDHNENLQTAILYTFLAVSIITPMSIIINRRFPYFFYPAKSI